MINGIISLKSDQNLWSETHPLVSPDYDTVNFPLGLIM